MILLASTFGAGRADAGVFSLFSTASGKTQGEAMPTIQKMKILEVAFSPALNGTGGEDVITDESALISSENPLLGDSSAENNPENQADADTPVDHQGESAITTYKVKPGDTISAIAATHGVSINTIVWANGIDRKETLKVGEILTILPVSGIEYTVKRGDTIDSIAKKYGAETVDIKEFNDITNANLVAGAKIIIPGAELSAPVTTDTKITVTPKIATNTLTTSPASDVADATSESAASDSDDSDNDGLIFGTLIRPKSNKGDSSSFIRPLEEGVGRKSQGLHDTWAVDIAAPIGTPIHAAEAGTVILVKSGSYNGGYGSYVVIEHAGGIQTLYAHMSKTIAKVGDVVAQGETIGLVGSTGRSTGPHVHYEVRGAPNNCVLSCN